MDDYKIVFGRNIMFRKLLLIVYIMFVRIIMIVVSEL